MTRILAPFALAALMLSLPAGSAHAQTTKTTTAAKTTATTKTALATVEQDLRTFSNWVDEKLELQMATVRLDWATLESDYTRMTKRLDSAAVGLSVQSKREYLGQKARYKAWAAENGHPVPETILVGEARDNALDNVQRKLLNTAAPINRAMASDLPSLYAQLVESTNAQHRTWTKTNWDQANQILERLNTRYDQVGSQLTIEDRVRVRSLQAEFRAQEKARDLKSILNGL